MINNRQGGRRRGRGGGGGGGPPRSNNPGPGNRQDNRQRGNAAQLLEKYKSLARDAQMGGDRVQTEYYLQYADHYFRLLNETRVRYEEQRRPRDDYGDEGEEQAGEAAREAIEPVGDEPATREEVYRERPRHEARDDFDERNGEFRGDRGSGRGTADVEDEEDDERIALDALPPAIAPSSEPEAEEAAPARAPRARRPRGDDEDVAPAA